MDGTHRAQQGPEVNAPHAPTQSRKLVARGHHRAGGDLGAHGARSHNGCDGEFAEVRLAFGLGVDRGRDARELRRIHDRHVRRPGCDEPQGGEGGEDHIDTHVAAPRMYPRQ